MNDSIKKVLEFHETFEHPIGLDSSHVEPLKTRQLRIKLIFEELAELAEASDVINTMYNMCENYCFEVENTGYQLDGNNVNKTEELDAIADIQYVLNGKILSSGLQHVFDKAFDQVHANNMNKAHRSVEHAEETANKNNMQGYKILNKNSHIILHNSDGKLTKPHDHVKVKLTL